jgi:hypothetical protein
VAGGAGQMVMIATGACAKGGMTGEVLVGSSFTRATLASAESSTM